VSGAAMPHITMPPCYTPLLLSYTGAHGTIMQHITGYTPGYTNSSWVYSSGRSAKAVDATAVPT